ncbi:hypothetical protein HWX41_16675 [Bacillus paramycoides]|uniref:hypothetical protein n=1 Tax=Bacillus paramycoides TaxID=2026194 RepID=UPI0015BAE9FA|nr:hypothetical protein [Bacillus paramycoides]NWK70664.1 hypothetical protein [Bacillus paramycoides]
MGNTESWETVAKLDAYKLINEILDAFKDENAKPFFWDEKNAKKHLKERRDRKHLSRNATMDDYNKIIVEILTDSPHMGLHEEEDKYVFGSRNVNNGERWIVILTSERKVVTAYKSDTEDQFFNHFLHPYFSVGTHYGLIEEFGHDNELGED